MTKGFDPFSNTSMLMCDMSTVHLALIVLKDGTWYNFTAKHKGLNAQEASVKIRDAIALLEEA